MRRLLHKYNNNLSVYSDNPTYKYQVGINSEGVGVSFPIHLVHGWS